MSQPSWAAEPLKIGKPTDLPQIGLRISLPAEQTAEVASQPFVLQSRDCKGEQCNSLCRLTFPRLPKTQEGNLQKMCEQVTAAVTGGQKSEKLSSQETKAGSRVCWTIVTQTSNGDQIETIAVTTWKTEFTKENIALIYSLVVTVSGKDADKAEAISKAVMASVQDIPIRTPSEFKVESLAGQAEVKTENFAIGVPLGWMAIADLTNWKGASRNMRFVATANDAINNYSVPNVNVNIQTLNFDVKTDYQDKATLDRAVALFEKMYDTRIISTRALKTGTRSEFEVVTRTQPAPGIKGIMVQRQFSNENKIYTVTLTWNGNDSDLAVASMEKIMSGFRFLSDKESTTQPSSSEKTTTTPARQQKTN